MNSNERHFNNFFENNGLPATSKAVRKNKSWRKLTLNCVLNDRMNIGYLVMMSFHNTTDQ